MPLGPPIGGSGGGSSGDDLSLKSYTEQKGSYTLTGLDPTATLELDFDSGNLYDVTLDKSVSILTFSNVPDTSDAVSFAVRFIQGGVGSFTITWPASIKWNGGEAATLSTGVGDYDYISFVTNDGGTTFDAFIGGQAFA